MAHFDLDVLIREIGPFGKYQLTNYLLLCLPIAITTMYTLTYVFTGGDLKYRCKIPACDQAGSAPPLDPLQSAFINFTVPITDTGKWSQCLAYKYSGGSDGDYADCRSENFDRTIVEECSEFVYQSDEQTIQSSFDLTCNEEWKLAFLGTINNIGQFLCLPLTGFVSDRFGRRTAFVLGILFSGLFGVLRGFSVNYTMFVIFEFLEPLFGSGVYSAGFILGKEGATNPPKDIINGKLYFFYSNGICRPLETCSGHVHHQYILYTGFGCSGWSCVLH